MFILAIKGKMFPKIHKNLLKNKPKKGQTYTALRIKTAYKEQIEDGFDIVVVNVIVAVIVIVLSRYSSVDGDKCRLRPPMPALRPVRWGGVQLIQSRPSVSPVPAGQPHLPGGPRPGGDGPGHHGGHRGGGEPGDEVPGRSPLLCEEQCEDVSVWGGRLPD